MSPLFPSPVPSKAISLRFVQFITRRIPFNDVPQASGDKTNRLFDSFLNRLDEGSAAREGASGDRVLYVYGHYFYTLLRGYFKYPGSLPGFVDELYSLVGRALQRAEAGHLGFGHVVEPPYVYVFRLEKVYDGAGRSYGHFHFIKVRLEDYMGKGLTPLDFKRLFLDHKTFLDKYDSGELEHFVRPGPATVSTNRVAHPLPHGVTAYRTDQSYAIIYDQTLDMQDVASSVFSELPETYNVNVMVGFPLDPYESRSYLVISDEDSVKLDDRWRPERVGPPELRAHLRALIKERYGPIVEGLNELPQKLKLVDNTDDARKLLNRFGRAVAWMDSVGLGDYLDYSGPKGLIKKLTDFLERGEVDATLLEYPLVAKETKERVTRLLYDCFAGQCKEGDIAYLVKIANLRQNMVEEALENVIEESTKNTESNDRKPSLRFLLLVYKKDMKLARKMFVEILRSVDKSILPVSFKSYTESVEGVFDKIEFIRVALSLDRDLAEYAKQKEREVKEEMEEKCKRVWEKELRELEDDLLKRIFKEYKRIRVEE